MTLDRRTRIKLLTQLQQLIVTNCLKSIKNVFKSLQPEQRIQLLNSTFHGCVPLYVAISHKRVGISRYLIDLALTQGRCKMIDIWKKSWHPLIAAIHIGNQNLIAQIVLYLNDINDNINGLFTPLMIGTFLGSLISVKLIVTLGADINRLGFHRRSPLMESTFDSEICRFLISQGANVNHQDEEGCTALHIAVTGRRIESVIHLIKAGTDVKLKNFEGMNSLIWATINVNIPAIYRLINQPAYTNLDRIEAFEILNACIVCTQERFVMFWTQALVMRNVQGFPKNCQIPAQEILDLSQEFTTERELEDLIHSPLHLAFQGILVIERILGKNNRVYLQVLLQTALIAYQQNHFLKLKELINYIHKYCQETSFVAPNLSYFKSLFEEISKQSNSGFFEYGGFALFKLIAKSTVEMWATYKDHINSFPFLHDNHHYEFVDTFLYMTSTIIDMNISHLYIWQFRKEVEKVVRKDVKVLVHQSILHRAIKLTKLTPWSTVELLRVLLESGAQINSKDYIRRTPVMYALKHVPDDILIDVLALFSEYEFHPDCRNNEDFTAMDSKYWGRSWINRNTPLSLKCLATGVILDKGINYERYLPKILKDFVNLHK